MELVVWHTAVYGPPAPSGMQEQPLTGHRFTVEARGGQGRKCLADAALFEMARVQGLGGLGPMTAQDWTEDADGRRVTLTRTYATVYQTPPE